MKSSTLARWLSAFAFDLAVIAVAVASTYLAGRWDSPLRFVVYFAAVLVIGCRQHALMGLIHDAAHRLVVRGNKANDLLGDVAGMLVFASVASYRDFHFRHHRHLGTKDDPEYDAKHALSALGELWLLPRTRRSFYRELLLSLLGLRFYCTLFVITGLFPRRPSGIAFLAVPWAAFVAASWATGHWWPLALWMWSLAAGFWTASWLRMWTEHVGSTTTHRTSATWWQKFFIMPHNTWCHWEHHERPGIPFSRLPSARGEIDGPAVVSLGELWRAFDSAKNIESWRPPVAHKDN